MSEKNNEIDRQDWYHRITDTSNLWLIATNLEDDGNLEEAIKIYLKDATLSWEKGSLVKAALSCACAASCLEKIGYSKIARALYFESATIYEKNAHAMMDVSIREALWSLQRAYESCVLAESVRKAEELLYNYRSLLVKISPFDGIDESRILFEFKLVPIDMAHFSEIDSNKKITRIDQSIKTTPIPTDLSISLDTFLQSRASNVRVNDLTSEMNLNSHYDKEYGRMPITFKRGEEKPENYIDD